MSTELTVLVRDSLIAQLESQHQGIRSTIEPLSDSQLWAKPVQPGNSIGHLILHLSGNLNHFVGAQLGGTGYVRDREREFNESSPPPRAILLAEFDAAVATFRQVVGGLTTDQLTAPHPESRFGAVAAALIHLVSHFALHRGQISYLARLAPVGS